MDYDLISFLFAQPHDEVYAALTGPESLRVVGGWGTGKTMLLKYLAFESQRKRNGGSQAATWSQPFVGLYLRMGATSIRAFLKPDGEFKDGGDVLFGHLINLCLLREALKAICDGIVGGVFSIPIGDQALTHEIEDLLLPVTPPPHTAVRVWGPSKSLAELLDRVVGLITELQTFLNNRDLRPDQSYLDSLTIHPTDTKNFLNDATAVLEREVTGLSGKSFYLLLDECEFLSAGQQRVVNTLVKQRHRRLVFKLATRPPDIRTMSTNDRGVGLTDREIKRLYLDLQYDPSRTTFRDLCLDVAKKRLDRANYANTDISTLLGEFAVESEVSKTQILDYLRRKYPNKSQFRLNKARIYKDYKLVVAFQIRGSDKLYCGFETFALLSSGIMTHFLELCREAFDLAIEENLVVERQGKFDLRIKHIRKEIQDRAARRVSESFYDGILARADSLADPTSPVEFGSRIQLMVKILTAVFKARLNTFSQPESARIEIPEGHRALDSSRENPIRQIVETAISISVLQEWSEYAPRASGEVRANTYILNRVLSPYPSVISPRVRWSTRIPAATFNQILQVPATRFQSLVLTKAKADHKAQRKEPSIDLLSPQLPLLEYLAAQTKGSPFAGKRLILVLHMLRDLIPFVEQVIKLGAAPDDMTILYKPYPYRGKEMVGSHLRSLGCRVHPAEELDTVLRGASLADRKPLIVVEDGGYVVSMLHIGTYGELLSQILGAVEQTTKGLKADEGVADLRFPVISIPDCAIKRKFEPPHIARAVVFNLQRLLPDIYLNGKEAAVVGFGSIGEAVALQLRDTLHLIVTVFDSDPTKRTSAKNAGYTIASTAEDAVANKTLVVGCSGTTSIGTKEFLAMAHGTYLVSTSSDRIEFDLKELEALSSKQTSIHPAANVTDLPSIGTEFRVRPTSKTLYLLADGYPINFWYTDSMPKDVSDLIMSLLFVASVSIASKPPRKKGIIRDVVDALVREGKIDELYLKMHE